MSWRDSLPKPPAQYDPYNEADVENIIKLYDVKIHREDNPPIPGWGVVYVAGGGIMCPFLKGDNENGNRAKKVIALSVYLHITGVDAGLCDTLAYWFIQGPEFVT